MQYKLTGVVRRTVEEEYNVTVEASSQDEAADITYAVLSDFPDSELSAVRLLCTRRESLGEGTVLDIACENDNAANDVEDEDDYA